MFSHLYNEATIQFEMHTNSPLFIDSGEQDQLDPTIADHTYLKSYKDGELLPVIPGTTLKGVFRSSGEQLLNKSCNIFVNACGRVAQTKKTGKARYEHSCPACKLFGSTAIKSRISFSDAYPIEEAKIGRRTSAAMDRITGATKRAALYNFEYIEDATFKCQIKLRNFFKWQVKLIFEIFDRIDDGYVTFGGFTSKGFGQMKIGKVRMKVRYYDKQKEAIGYVDKNLCIEKIIKGRKEILQLLSDVSIKDENLLQGSDLKYDKAI